MRWLLLLITVGSGISSLIYFPDWHKYEVDGLLVKSGKDVKTIKELSESQQQVNRLHNTVSKELKELESHINTRKPWSISKEQKAFSELERLVPIMIKEARRLLDRQRIFARDLHQYQESLGDAKSLYEATAQVYQRYAASEQDTYFKDLYTHLANKCRTLGPIMQKRAETISGLTSSIEEKLKFVERSLVFLERLQDFINVFRQADAGGPEVQEYLDRLAAYIDNFETMIRSLKGLTERMEKEPIPAVEIQSK